MARVFVVGAAGRIGTRLVRRLVARGHGVAALHRRPEQAEGLAAAGASPVAGSLAELSAAHLAQAMAGSGAVVFCAGAGGTGPEATQAIDGRGLELTAAAVAHAGVRRLVLVSAFPEAGRDRDRDRSEGFEHYLRVKKGAEAHLCATDLDWVILRPGLLSDEPGTGRVRAGAAVPYGSISREDVAAALVEIVERPGIARRVVEITSGPTPVGEAMARLAGR